MQLTPLATLWRIRNCLGDGHKTLTTPIAKLFATVIALKSTLHLPAPILPLPSCLINHGSSEAAVETRFFVSLAPLLR